MSVITKVPEPNIWEEICKEYENQRPPFKDEDNASVHTVKENYDPCKVTPVFYGKMFAPMQGDSDIFGEFDASLSHPACVGYAFVDKPPPSPPPPEPQAPDKNTCSPRTYMEHYIFPTLLPALEQMLYTAKTERCFERKRTKFNALDFLTEQLYKKNPASSGREDVILWDIPFVKEWLKEHPRPPLPMSLLWTEEEATLIIQSFWRGYKIRREPHVQELRQWQREWRAENENINNKVSEFWAKQMPEESASDEQVATADPSEGELQNDIASEAETSDVILRDNNPHGTPHPTPETTISQ